MRWRIRLKKVSDNELTIVSVPSEYGDDFEENPVLGISRSAAVWFRTNQKPISEWSIAAIVGRYIEAYEARYCRKWSGGPSLFRDVVRSIKILVEREDAATACRAIDVVFSTEMRWVSSDHLGFILRPNTFTRFVVPAMDKMMSKTKVRGESSEWVGARNNGSVEEVGL